MDMQLVNKGLDFTRKKRKWVLILAAFGITGYGAYEVYNLPSVVRRRKRLLRLLGALVSIAEAVSDCTELIGIVSRDLRAFMQSDSDDIPKSLRQINKLVKSEECKDSVVRITEAVARGVFRGYQRESGGGSDGSVSSSGFYDRFMDRLFSEGSTGFVSVVAGSFARNLVRGFYDGDGSERGVDVGERKGGDGSSWVNVMCSERCRDLVGECIEKFVSTAVAVYLDRTMNMNTYDDLFAGLTNPKHEKQVRDMLVALCNGSIETLVKTSHQVLTSSNSGDKLESLSSDLSRFVVTRSNSDVVSRTFCPEINDARNVITVKQTKPGAFLDFGEDRKASSGDSWVSTVSSTLAVPSNRKFVLDVTGRVTFETVRSFLELLLEKLFAGIKRSFRAVNEVIIDTGFEVVRYVTAKTYVVASVCISLCLHVLGGTWELLPA